MVFNVLPLVFQQRHSTSCGWGVSNSIGADQGATQQVARGFLHASHSIWKSLHDCHHVGQVLPRLTTLRLVAIASGPMLQGILFLISGKFLDGVPRDVV